MKDNILSKNFSLYIGANFASFFGTYIYELVIGFWVMVLTGSPVLTGLVMATSRFARIAVLPIGGVFADFLGRKKILIAVDFFRGIILLIVAGLAFTNNLTIELLFIMAILVGVAYSFFLPATRAIIPDIVSKKKLVTANAFMRISENISNALGNYFGGVLFQLVGAPFLFLINGFSFILSAILEFFIDLPITKPRKFDFLSNLKSGFVYVIKDTGLRHHLMFGAFFNFFVYTGMVLFIPLFNNFYSPAEYGLVMGASAMGMVSGAVLSNFIKNTKHAFILSIVLQSWFYIAFAFSQSVLLMAVLLFFGGLFNSIMNTIIGAGIQNYVSNDMRGKVISIIFFFVGASVPIGMLFGGALGEVFDLRLVIATAFFLAWLVAMRFVFSKQLLKIMTIKSY